MKKLILISGPSCVGKGPLLAALRMFYSNLNFGDIPVIKSHASRNGKPRPNEILLWNNPAYFLPDSSFGELSRERYVIGNCRGYPQAIDLLQISRAKKDLLILEVYHTIGAQFLNSDYPILNGIDIQSIFISPVSTNDMELLNSSGVDMDMYITHIMIHKQMLRLSFMEYDISDIEMKDILERAKDTSEEVRKMNRFTSIIICGDGEGHPNWNQNPDGSFRDYPRGDAQKALNELVRIIMN